MKVNAFFVFFFFSAAVLPADSVTIVNRPDTTGTNSHYTSNRPPLVPSQLIQLPAGSIRPEGWLLEYLHRQRDGLTGNLGRISAWLNKQDNAWLSPEGKGQWGWEEVPYWLRGFLELAYILNDPDMIREANIWIEGTLRSRRENGDFGPDHRFEDGSRDYWANMVMLYCLQSYYEYSNDQRVLDLMTRYFRHQKTVPDDALLTGYWQRMRGGDNLYSIYWLYNRTGEKWLLEAAEKIHRNTADWRMEKDLPNWHNVNIAQGFREPAIWYLQSRDPGDLQFAYKNFHEVRARYGQVPGGMFGGDENCRPGYDDPRQSIETCGIIEQMFSNEMLMRISGDPFWADHCEEVALNTYPAAVMPDFRSLRYLTAPNMVISDQENHHPGIDNQGPFLMMNPFSSRCCQHNHSFGWPYYSKSLWWATPDNGVCAALYAAGRVRVKVADGTEITWVEQTNYPFEEQVRLTLSAPDPVEFPLYLRVPGWCEKPALSLNGKPIPLPSSAKGYIRIERIWKDGDQVTLDVPMEIRLHTWTANHNSVSVRYGPLTFSLKIKENYVRRDSTKTAVWDSKWQKGADPRQWPSYEIHPASAWNYGLLLDKNSPEKSFRLIKKEGPRDNFPFTLESVPLAMEVSARKIPNWTRDQYGLCAVLQDSPVRSDEPTETVTLIPMGAARLRISAFPTIGQGPEARPWQPSISSPRPANPKSIDSVQSVANNEFARWGKQTLKTIERDHRREGQPGYYENQDKKEVAFTWSNSMLLLAYAGAAQADPSYAQPLDDLMRHIDRYWITHQGIGGYDHLPHPRPAVERYYDDNAWIAMGQIDAWHAAGQKKYLEAAQKTLAFCLSGIDPRSGGIWWREYGDRPSQKTKNTCSVAPTAFACLRYHEATREKKYLETAMELMTWLDAHLKDEDNLYFDHLKASGRIGRRKWSYNSAMPLRCYVLLYRLTGQTEYLNKAIQIAQASQLRWADSASGAIRCESMFAYTLIEGWIELSEATGDRQWIDRARLSMRYVHDKVRDAAGRYSKRWDDANAAPITQWKLLYPAAAARAYWALAEADQPLDP